MNSNYNPSHTKHQLTQALTDALGLLHAVRAEVVEAHGEGVTVVLMLHPHGLTVALRTVIVLWSNLQSGS